MLIKNATKKLKSEGSYLMLNILTEKISFE